MAERERREEEEERRGKQIREEAEKRKEVWTEPEKEVTKMGDVCEGLEVVDSNLEKEETNEQMMKVDNNVEKEEASDNTSDCGFAENESGYDSDKEINEEDDEDDLMEGNLQSERLKKNLEEFCYSSVFWLGYDE